MVVSVCAQARDLKNALHAADMLRHAGLKPDTIFYTNLIKGGFVGWGVRFKSSGQPASVL